MLTPSLLHMGGIACAMVLSAFGAGIGQAFAIGESLRSLERQDSANQAVKQLLFLGAMIIDTGACFAMVFAIIMLFVIPRADNLGAGLAIFGSGLSLGIASLSTGIASGFVVKWACASASRHPFTFQKIRTFMLIFQTLCETPIIFAFIINMLIKNSLPTITTQPEGIKFLAGALSIGCGTIGPSIGQAILASSGIRTLGLNLHAYTRIFTFTILSEALVSTPLIFSMLIALQIINMPIPLNIPFLHIIVLLTAPFIMMLGGIGAATGAAHVASETFEGIVFKSEHYKTFIRTSLMGQALIGSCGIFSFIIALLIISKIG